MTKVDTEKTISRRILKIRTWNFGKVLYTSTRSFAKGRFVCSCPRCLCTTQKWCSSHLATPSISSSSMCHLSRTPSYTHKTGCLETFTAFNMTCRTWTRVTGGTVWRAVHGSALSLTYGVWHCGILINIEYRAISGQIHRLYCWMNSLFYYNCQ